MITFEALPNNFRYNMERAKVPGGWLVRECTDCAHIGPELNEYITTGYDWRVTLTFVPDPEHKWLEGGAQ